MSLEIREMKRKYLADALSVYQWYVRNSTVTFQKRDSDIAEMEELLFFEKSKYRSFAVFEDLHFIGYGIITQYKKREAFDRSAEVTIYLAGDASGKGYGRVILSYLEDFARSQELHVLVALISGENGASCKLFERNGYTKCAHYHEVGYKFERYIDLVCYEKKLAHT